MVRVSGWSCDEIGVRNGSICRGEIWMDGGMEGWNCVCEESGKRERGFI